MTTVYRTSTGSLYTHTNALTNLTSVHYKELTGGYGECIILGWDVPIHLSEDVMRELAHALHKKRPLEQACQRLAVLGFITVPAYTNDLGIGVLERAGLDVSAHKELDW